ncbi:hypothetical protein [Bradyrhizobium sp. CCBAU 51627]|uniref:hypothetical protein n=1 Tax=Bradyrhizobium sp. CCBAU 51627 TaxID=1325088 RepID=UPI002305FE9C|nr:hypothetical protein [Bradyrhizobium sp. CCBAU 51627]
MLLGALCALSGCQTAGADANIYGGAFGQRVVGNETYVTVSNVWNEMDALPLADQHCKQFSKAARFNRMEGPRAIFDCVR